MRKKIFDEELFHLTPAEYERRQEKYKKSSDYQYFINLQNILKEIADEIRERVAKANANYKVFMERIEFMGLFPL